MSSLKIVLRTNKRRKDGSCPLALRIIKDRQARFIFLGQYIQGKQWDEEHRRVRKSHPNSKRINNLILKKLSEANDTILESESNDLDHSPKQIKNKIKRSGKKISFFDMAAQRIKSNEHKGTFSVANAERSITNNLKKFTGGKDLAFQDVTPPFIERFKVYCASKLNQKPRTVTNQLIFVRTMFNIAIKEGVVNPKYYPFAGDNVRIKIRSGLKIGLTKEEIKNIEGLDLSSDTSFWHTRNVWLFAFYFAGIRISDVLHLRWSDFKDDRLHYIMSKNKKPVTLKIPEKAKAILKLYKDDKGSNEDYVFPDLKKANQENRRDVFLKIRNASRRFNNDLKKIAKMAKIKKNLSNHIARHSFGNLAGDKIHPLMLQKLYRHSDLKTTINYQANFIHKKADEALDSVVDF